MKKTISRVLFLVFIIGLIPGVAKAKLVACVGDSITYGYGLTDWASNCYPAQLARMLQPFDNEWQAQNFGANGATLLRKGDQPYVAKSVYNPARASAPEVVIIMLGSNDSWPSNWVHKDNFIPDYLALIDAFAGLPSNPKIFICCPPPIWGRPWGLDGIVLKDQIIPKIYEVAELRDVGVIDLHTPLEDSIHLFPDGCHPNTEGARTIAEIVASMILGFRFSPDLDGDYKVDIEDLIILIEHWGRDESFCDIAPSPFGDGIVDRADLEALMAYWGQEINDLTLIAHWGLDEVEGDVAYDSASQNDAKVIGEAIWQPENGQIDGALQFDGVTSYVEAPFLFNPADPEMSSGFSVLAWIKGGSPNQVIISQAQGMNWLAVDTDQGFLRTDLTNIARGKPGPSLISTTVITDGNWHRVGLVWNGASRILYVDNVEVARDEPGNLEPSDGGLFIGAGAGLEVGTFWSGLIDDVRIYDRAVEP